jgi:hypothetical protein
MEKGISVSVNYHFDKNTEPKVKFDRLSDETFHLRIGHSTVDNVTFFGTLPQLTKILQGLQVEFAKCLMPADFEEGIE